MNTPRVARRTLHVARCLAVALLLVGLPAGVAAQTAQQLEMLRQNPELVRQQIARSGMSEAEIRQRLRSAGYDPALFDAFLADGSAGVSEAAVSPDMLVALQVLGIDLQDIEGLEDVPQVVGSRPGLGMPADTVLHLFGLDMFRRPTTEFQPLLSGPVPPTYRIGAGDVLVLVLTGDVELVHELTVTREGFVVIPQVGQLAVGGLTMEQLEGLLRQRLGRSYSGVRTGTTRFDVTVARLRANQVYVVGEVLQPGAYQLSSVASVLNALYAAGGLTERANFRSVVVRRGVDTVAVLDVYEYMIAGDPRNDVMLEQGDVVFVPTRGPRASISGPVVRPAIYELAAEETLADLVRMAGGFAANAERRRLTIHRILPATDRVPGPSPRAVMDVPLSPIDEDGSARRGVRVPPVVLEDGDSVVVDSIPSFAESMYVTIGGMVKKPGKYPWSEGMTLRDLMDLAQGTRVGADLREAEIARLPQDRRSGDLVLASRVPLDSTYLFERDSLGRYVGPAGLPFPSAGSAPEVRLEPFDLVSIFRQPEFELQRTVWITGEVRFPGPYALRNKDERVSDLVERAGGLLRTAYEDGARFYRALDSAGRIDLDLVSARAVPRSQTDIVLQPGDSLSIPEFIPTVRVEGAVVSPTSVMHQEGAKLEYYIANAGGYARNADKGRVSVRFANGSAQVKRKRLFLATAPVPGPGSVVTVPEVPPGEGIDTTALLGTVAQILTSAVAIIAIVVK